MKLNRFLLTMNTVLVVFLYSENLFCQTTDIAVVDSTSKTENRLKFGFGFGLSFVGGTNISLAPNLMYEVSNKVSLGGGIQGSYTSIKDLQNTTTFGANIITQYRPIRQLTTLLEFAQLKVNTKTETPTGKITDDYWDTALFVGLGWNINEKISVGASTTCCIRKMKAYIPVPYCRS